VGELRLPHRDHWIAVESQVE